MVPVAWYTPKNGSVKSQLDKSWFDGYHTGMAKFIGRKEELALKSTCGNLDSRKPPAYNLVV